MEYKILQYADDTHLFTLFSEESIKAILQTFSKFSEKYLVLKSILKSQRYYASVI